MNYKQRIAARFARAEDYKHHAIIQEKICHELAEKITLSHPARILEIGAGDGLLSEILARKYAKSDFVINELCPEKRDILEKIAPHAEILIGDAEHMEWTGNFDLIISGNTVQWFDEPLSFPARMAKYLNAGGQLIFNTFLPPHFQEIRQLTGQGLNYPPREKWLYCLKPHFSAVHSEIIEETLYFPTPRAVLAHLRATGVTAAGEMRWTKGRLQNFERAYPDTSQGYPLTYCALLLMGQKN